jgi:hypothetical protein
MRELNKRLNKRDLFLKCRIGLTLTKLDLDNTHGSFESDNLNTFPSL